MYSIKSSLDIIIYYTIDFIIYFLKSMIILTYKPKI